MIKIAKQLIARAFFFSLFLLISCVGYGQSKEQTDSSEVLTFADQMPEYPGGMEEMYKFLSRNVVYPKELRKKNINGKVVLNFLVMEDGSINNIESILPTEALFEKEAIRVVSIMPKWAPGKINGKPVTLKYTLPIRFQIN